MGVDDGVAAVREPIALLHRGIRTGTVDPIDAHSLSHVEELEALITAGERVVVVHGQAAEQLSVLRAERCELGVFHSHVSSPPRPSRTDVENIGLWQGRPYLILTVRTGELAAWRIANGEISELRLSFVS